ncbi:MAG: glycerophosphodiester phosphodiesterase family protein [Proteobacteria bacterium]|nr:glycerophosphodiester phosphodiesterase family protein [Pseudomonadota bacterium]
MLVLFVLPLASACKESSPPTGDSDTDVQLTTVELAQCLVDPDCDYLFSCGHRGTILSAPENTLIGFETALAQGMDAVEVDVRHTSDDVLVLMHDTTVDRTTDGTGEVALMTLAEIRQLKVISEFDGIEDQPVPTFLEALEAFEGRALFNVDAKTDRMDLIAADLIAAGMQSWAYVQVSVDEGLVLKDADPSIVLLPGADTVEHVEDIYEALEPEMIQFAWHMTDTEPIDAALELGLRVTQDSLNLVDAAAINHEANGEDPCQAFAPIWERGVSLIQTDVPLLLMPCLDELNAQAGLKGP